ncbi:MAG: hypothetical protein A3K19_20590 [Lentisphaerae bacterium RIFOXYB12_FULL_65_16]|nr:MAG: hypothetical protein A3K18_22180 [Lentisphaerae bacterium RIFOXYA12_64_32]OGV89396.1 MAG: hypothetical protein A3K19_20590 [Lentisphaerae bacterium RIFOXYB12_FULL_65_16]
MTITSRSSHRMAPSGGRPSNSTAFPFFNVQFGEQGVITAIGWSGQWAAEFDRDKAVGAASPAPASRT